MTNISTCTVCADAYQHYSMVINLVLATDIMDKELGGLRKARWEKAFNKPVSSRNLLQVEDSHTETNRKATIVLEHLIQASDVAHTMQVRTPKATR